MLRPHHVYLAGLAALALCADVSLAQKKPPVATSAGVVKSADAEKGTLTLAGRKMKDGTVSDDLTLAVAKDAKIIVDGKEAKLADVKPEAVALVTLSEDKKSATAVSVNGGTAHGVVKSVEAKALTITIAGKKLKNGESEPDQTLAVIKDAKVTIAGEAKALADLKEGAAVSLVVSSDKKTVLGVVVGSPKKPGTPSASGQVKLVDAKALTITLEGGKRKDGTVGEDVTLKVAKDAKVTIDGEAKTLADVTAGVKATLTLDAEKKNALAVTVGGRKKPK